VSGPSESNGYIEFQYNDGNNIRDEIAADNYVEFGIVGSLADLAGPVSRLQFTCYDAFDLSTPITDVNSMRCVKVQATLTNPAKVDQDMTFTTQAYIRTNALPAAGGGISKKSAPWPAFDPVAGQYPALAQISSTQYLCAYEGDNQDGYACVLTVYPDDWSISAGAFLEYDTKSGLYPAVARISDTHFLCAYSGDRSDGFACVLEYTGPATLSKRSSLEFYTADCSTPALCQIDTTHYLCAYSDLETGYTTSAVVLTVDAGSWSISSGTSSSFPSAPAPNPVLAKIDETHYLCVYEGQTGGTHGAAVVLTVNPADWTISAGTHFDFFGECADSAEVAKIDDTHYLCSYICSGDGRVTVLAVNPADWTVTKEPGPDFFIGSTSGSLPLCGIDSASFLCAYDSVLDGGTAVVLTVNVGDWSISKTTPLVFEGGDCVQHALCQIDARHYLCAYSGPGSAGIAGVLESSGDGILP
jgi:uncharacterized protein YaiE (UPF0345 family)